jgi:hypothetical protein
MAYYPYQQSPYQGQYADPTAQAQAPVDRKKQLFSQLMRVGGMMAPMLINAALHSNVPSGKGGSE